MKGSILKHTKKLRHYAASFVMLQWSKMSLLSAKVYSLLWQKGNGDMIEELKGIEAELRGVQYSIGAAGALRWWDRNFAHKYIDYVYDANEEKIVRRDGKT